MSWKHTVPVENVKGVDRHDGLTSDQVKESSNVVGTERSPPQLQVPRIDLLATYSSFLLSRIRHGVRRCMSSTLVRQSRWWQISDAKLEASTSQGASQAPIPHLDVQSHQTCMCLPYCTTLTKNEYKVSNITIAAGCRACYQLPTQQRTRLSQ